MLCVLQRSDMFLCRRLCQELAPSSQALVDAFGIPDHLVAAPIATDWEGYNRVDNQGELAGSAFEPEAAIPP